MHTDRGIIMGQHKTYQQTSDYHHTTNFKQLEKQIFDSISSKKVDFFASSLVQIMSNPFCDINSITTGKGYTMLDILTTSDYNLPALKCLLNFESERIQKGDIFKALDLRQEDFFGCSSLAQAAKSGAVGIAKELISRDASLINNFECYNPVDSRIY